MEYFKNKKNITNVAILIVAILVSFYAGTMFAKSQTPARGQFSQQGMMVTNGQFGGGSGVRGTRGAGFVSGDIIAKDATSITVKAQDGSTKIVLVSGSTQIGKATIGTVADLGVGTAVIATGATNADGSVTAQSVQIRAAGSIPTRTQIPQAQPQAN